MLLCVVYVLTYFTAPFQKKLGCCGNTNVNVSVNTESDQCAIHLLLYLIAHNIKTEY